MDSQRSWCFQPAAPDAEWRGAPRSSSALQRRHCKGQMLSTFVIFFFHLKSHYNWSEPVCCCNAVQRSHFWLRRLKENPTQPGRGRGSAEFCGKSTNITLWLSVFTQVATFKRLWTCVTAATSVLYSKSCTFGSHHDRNRGKTRWRPFFFPLTRLPAVSQVTHSDVVFSTTDSSDI